MGKPKTWEIRFSRDDQNDAVSSVALALGVSRLTASLLVHRGCPTPEAARRFVRIEEERLFDPFALRDMDRAAGRVLRALETGEPMLVWGDYDADGVTATALLYSYLKKCGANVTYFVPDRFRDGYGMNCRAIGEFADRGISLIVTVDNGISANEPIAYAYERGMEVVVTDHHQPHGTLPSAEAVVDPFRADETYPFRDLAGVGVAFKLACAVESLRTPSEDWLRRLCGEQLDLVAFGTIADVMPLVGENRLMVSMGLHLLSTSPRLGLRTLMEQASVHRTPTASTVSFTLAPRINAAGRLGSAMRAIELLLSESEIKATEIAFALCEQNRERQQVENGIFASCEKRITALGAERAQVLVLDHDDWHPGITGIAASRVAERYARPTFLITYDGEVGKGSGRSVEGVNLMALLAGCDDLLIQYGGHEMAAGLTVRRDAVDDFRRRINEIAAAQFPEGIPTPVAYADCEITLSDVTPEQIHQLSYLEPCGTGNPQPVFWLKDAVLREMVPVGGGKHARILLEQGGRTLTAMYFGTSPERLDYQIGDRVDLLVQMDLNSFNGRITPQLLIRDMDHTSSERKRTARPKRALENFAAGGEAEDILRPYLPLRGDFVRVYQYLRRTCREGAIEISARALGRLLFAPEEGEIKCPLVLAVFAQTGLLGIEELEAGIADTGTQRGKRLRITVPPQAKTVDLNDSPLYRRIEQTAMPLSQDRKESSSGI